MICCFSFYRQLNDVKDDKELQAFVNELSAQGTGPDGGRGQVIKIIFAIDYMNAHVRGRRAHESAHDRLGVPPRSMQTHGISRKIIVCLHLPLVESRTKQTNMKR